MRKRSVHRLILVALGLAAVAVISWFILHWTEVVRIPLALREVRRLQEIADRQDDPGRREDEDLRRALDAAANDLVRLQVPGFDDGDFFQLQQISTDDGTTVFLLCYHRNPLERLPHPECGLFLPRYLGYHHRFLRADGTS
jgi:hypothetical protein